MKWILELQKSSLDLRVEIQYGIFFMCIDDLKQFENAYIQKSLILNFQFKDIYIIKDIKQLHIDFALGFCNHYLKFGQMTIQYQKRNQHIYQQTLKKMENQIFLPKYNKIYKFSLLLKSQRMLKQSSKDLKY
ncbi:unnamed protein product [Paramecium pentaurelia]|uniref:Uncharacterized protein n=1 Tax=Paramecium pentaurelia TaxID=43138 RepID=A0A8S1XGK5_9CILI|nr:unnamed protein product [Paramecium pentaurelia]